MLNLASQTLGGVLHSHKNHPKTHQGYHTPTQAPSHNYGAPAALPISSGYGAPAAAPISTGYGVPQAPPIPAAPLEPEPEVIQDVPEFLLEPQPIEDIDLAHPAPPVISPGFIRTNAMNPRFSVPFAPIPQYVDDIDEDIPYTIEETQYVVPYNPFGFGFQYYTEDQPSDCVTCQEQILDPDYYTIFEDNGQYQNVDYVYENEFPVAVTDTPEVKVAKAVFEQAYQEALKRSSG